MTKYNEYLEMRLQEWAEWFKQGRNSGVMGFPNETVLHKLWMDGIVLHSRTGSAGSLPTNSRAEEIEWWVMDMQKCIPELALVMRAKYFAPRKIPIEAIAKRNKMSRRGFEDKLRLARNFILSRLTISNSNIEIK